MKNFIKPILAIAGVAIVVIFLALFFKAMDNERCNDLKSQERYGYNGFYITRQERIDCSNIGIIINAPIK